MAMGNYKVLNADFASGSTFSTEVNIAGFNKISIEVPGFTAALSTQSANVYVNVAQEKGGTYRRLKDMGVYSANSGIYDWETPKSIGDFVVPCRPLSGFHWCKLETANGATFNATCTAGMAAKIHVAQSE